MERLFVSSPQETVEVCELMQSRHVTDQQLAIDALTGWCRAREESSYAPLGKNYYDIHHWHNRRARRGAPFAQWGSKHTQLLRRDIHESVEAHFGWLVRPYIKEIGGVE